MHPAFGLLLIAAVGLGLRKLLLPLAQARQAEAQRIPDGARLQRQLSVARGALTVLVVLLALAALLAVEAVVYGAAGRASARWEAAGGALALLAGLWCPWPALRILAALALLAASGLGALAALFIAAGGPDSRGENLPGAGIILLGAVLVVAAPALALLHAELGLRRLDSGS